MADRYSPAEGILVRVQVRRPGATVFQQTYQVSNAGDLSRAKCAALAMAVQDRPELRDSDLLTRIDPVSWSTNRHIQDVSAMAEMNQENVTEAASK